MEPISLGVGIFALVGLFDNAMACLNHVQVAKSLGTDLHVFIIRLECLQLRLTRWAVAVGLDKDIADATELKTTVLTREEIETAERLVGAIVKLMEKARETTQSLGSQGPEQVAMGDDASEPGTITLCKKMHEISVSRQRRAGAFNKAKWVISSKEKLLGLIESIEKLITNLENLFSPPTKAELAALCNQEAFQLRNEAALSLLEGEAKRLDQMLASAISKQKAVSCQRCLQWRKMLDADILTELPGQHLHQQRLHQSRQPGQPDLRWPDQQLPLIQPRNKRAHHQGPRSCQARGRWRDMGQQRSQAVPNAVWAMMRQCRN